MTAKPILDVASIRKLAADHDRLAHEVRELRTMLRALLAGGGGGFYQLAKVDASGISAASGTTVTKGKGNIYRLPAGSLTAVDTGFEVDIFNWCGAIPANSYLGLGLDEHVRHWAATGRC